ncbi:MAG: transglycosylase SLT domain-containing protein [Clostridiales bacterium]|nr:transglycosylase SLT domain-containing protein [Clostridiales bacterium]
MNPYPPVTPDLDGDDAPVDYTCVSSVSEGRRRRQLEAMHDRPTAPIVRHRADPDGRPVVDAYGTRARSGAQPAVPARDTVMKRLPSAADGPAPAQSVAYPEDYGIPDNPFDPPPQARRPSRRSRAASPAGPEASGAALAADGGPYAQEARGAGTAPQAASPSAAGPDAASFAQAAMRQASAPNAAGPDAASFAQAAMRQASAPNAAGPSATFSPRSAAAHPTAAAPGVGARIAMPVQPRVLVSQDGSEFEPPARPDIPDWLRVAQQNNLPLNRPSAPRVTAAPKQEEPPPTDVLGRPLRNRAAIAAARLPREPLPQSADAYAQAGYPPELLLEQQRLEREQAQQPIRRRHGAQYAVNDYRAQPGADTGGRRESRASYPPGRGEWEAAQAARQAMPAREEPQAPAAPEGRGQAYAAARMERAYTHPIRTFAAQQGYGDAALEPAPEQEGWQVVEEEAEEERPRLRIPWLGIAAFAMAFIAVGLWLAQLSFDRQTGQVLAQREATQAALLESHPLRYRELIEQKAQKYNLSPAFVAAIILNESSFRPDAESSVGARGLMQLMDETAGWICGKMNGAGYDFDAMYDAETNVEYGCWYLNFLSERFRGDPVLVAAAFHAGQGQVQNWLNDSRYSSDKLTIRLENMVDGPTKQYAARVLNAFAAYKRLYYEATEEPA